MLSGGSFVSWSVTSAAKTVTVQVSLGRKFVSGSRVNVVGPPATVAVCPSLVPQAIEYQPSATVTGSENVIVMFELTSTLLPPLAGVVELTEGATSARQLKMGEARLRGLGTAAKKSAPLLSVSVQPLLFRKPAVVFESVGAALVPSKKFAPS